MHIHAPCIGSNSHSQTCAADLLSVDVTNKREIIRSHRLVRRGIEKNKLIIIMVGLPGRGKTFLCNKLKCYLNWCAAETAAIYQVVLMTSTVQQARMVPQLVSPAPRENSVCPLNRSCT